MKAQNPTLKIRPIRFVSAILCLLFIAACGYKIQGRDTLPFETVKIGMIENRTYEPKLEDKFHKALADELLRNGFVLSKNAKHVITGVIHGFKIKPLTEKDKIAFEYEVIISGNFYLTYPDGRTKELRNSGAYTVSFSASGNLQNITASKESAIETAMKNLSSEIRAGVIYQQ